MWYTIKKNHGGDVLKVRILIAIVLVLLIAEFAFLANRLPADYEAAALQAQQQQEDIRQRTEQLEAKQEFLSSSKSDEAIALEEEADRVRMEAASLLAEMANIRAGEEDIKMQLTQLQEEFADVEEQYNYYVEVCNELEKGIETVKAYIAGN
jgi:chromosome segregation ATPase